jgi:hypothetical protein
MTVPVLMPHQRDHFELVKKSPHVIDIYRLKEAIDNIPIDYKNQQISLQMREGSEDPWYESCGQLKSMIKAESEYNLIIPELKGTYIDEMFQLLPFEPFRTRLMYLDKKSCYSIHRDYQPRYHVAIFTNPLAKIIFTEKERVFHIPSDGYLYFVDTREEHTAINGSLKEKRLHLLIGY